MNCHEKKWLIFCRCDCLLALQLAVNGRAYRHKVEGRKSLSALSTLLYFIVLS